MTYSKSNPQLASMFFHFQIIFLQHSGITVTTSCHVNGMPYKQ